MSQFITIRRLSVVVCLVAVFATGCTPSTLWYLAGGANKKIPPEVPLPPKEGKKEITVAIVASSAPGLTQEFAGVERELAGLVGRRMMDETAKDKHPIKVLEQDVVRKAVDRSGKAWKSTGLLCKELNADYIVELTVNSISMYQRELGPDFNQGRATVQVVVYDSAQPEKPMRDYMHNSDQQMKDGATTPYYRRWFVERLAVELASRHIPHMPDRELAPIK